MAEEAGSEGQVVMPFYIICDVSGSMCGDMVALNQGVADLQKEIMQDPVADDLVMLSVISFDDTARTVVPLDFPTAIKLKPLTCGGLTNYTAAFREFHRAFEADRTRLRGEGKKVFRPCVFFLSDGEPTVNDYQQVFKQLFGYDPATKQGNKAYPYVTPFGFRDATAATMEAIAYPDFGEKKGRYFLAKQGASVAQLLKEMTGVIANSVLSSGRSVGSGSAQFVPPATNSMSDMEGSFVD